MTVELASYRMFDYEKRLAAREQEALTRQAQQTGESPASLVARRSTYFVTASGALTRQASTEQRHHTLRGSSQGRQATRFLTHGLHEYKGKFNPQLARVLVNAVDPAAESLLDPFCGSGTALVEGMRLGLSVGGIDQNPLAAWMSRVKVEAQKLAGQAGLVSRFDCVADLMRLAMKEAQHAKSIVVPHNVTDKDSEYLHRWFPPGILAALWSALEACPSDGDAITEVARLCLSNIVREVSWQLPQDLRVRRRAEGWEPPNVAELFADAAERGRLALWELERADPQSTSIRVSVQLGSSREQEVVNRAWGSGRRLVVTSPPYATALPYIDTDRLSIVLLGLASSSDLRHLEQGLTGSREWKTSEARHWNAARSSDAFELPVEVTELLQNIETRNLRTEAGFRRMAVPTLLYRYFTQMAATMRALASSMRPGEHVVMVVGANRTGSGEYQTTIATPHLLGRVAEGAGFSFDELIPLQAWSRFALHSKNSTDIEEAIVLTVRS